ncbi:putative protein TPRXL isoform X2 [Melanotaenia boesemani]|nr:putative protein TPRXL isoform X2 [Melanotaenia boesemani]XP_041848982.1 putative protein TPRXL isoform X2 [Melanotaenia boesemani]
MYPRQAGTSTSPDLMEDPGNELPQRRESPAGGNETTTEPTTISQTDETVNSETSTDAGFETNFFTSSSTEATSEHTHALISTAAHLSTSSLSAAADRLSSMPALLKTTPHQTSATEGRALLTSNSIATFSSQSRHTVHDASSTVPTSTTQRRSEPPPASTPQTLASDHVPAAPTHAEVPSQLKVGDEDLEGSHRHSSSPLDPLLAGLLSVFIVTTAIVFIVLFLKFRQRTNHPEFHRLQDLPMDDLMEDTPLSRYTY